MEEELIEFETAKLAKKKGLSIGCFEHYVEYKTDYVYDEDPGHPESHKAGDIRCSHFYSKNEIGLTDKSQPNFVTYEALSQSLLQKWLRDEHDIDIVFSRTGIRDHWNLDGIQKFGYPFVESKHRHKTVFKTYEEVLEIGLQEALNIV